MFVFLEEGLNNENKRFAFINGSHTEGWRCSLSTGSEGCFFGKGESGLTCNWRWGPWGVGGLFRSIVETARIRCRPFLRRPSVLETVAVETQRGTSAPWLRRCRRVYPYWFWCGWRAQHSTSTTSTSANHINVRQILHLWTFDFLHFRRPNSIFHGRHFRGCKVSWHLGNDVWGIRVEIRYFKIRILDRNKKQDVWENYDFDKLLLQ